MGTDKEMNIFDLFAILKKRKTLFLVFFILLAGLGLFKILTPNNILGSHDIVLSYKLVADNNFIAETKENFDALFNSDEWKLNNKDLSMKSVSLRDKEIETKFSILANQDQYEAYAEKIDKDIYSAFEKYKTDEVSKINTKKLFYIEAEKQFSIIKNKKTSFSAEEIQTNLIIQRDLNKLNTDLAHLNTFTIKRSKIASYNTATYTPPLKSFWIIFSLIIAILATLIFESLAQYKAIRESK